MYGCLKYGGILLIIIGVFCMLGGIGVSGSIDDMVLRLKTGESASEFDVVSYELLAVTFTLIIVGFTSLGAIVALIGVVSSIAGHAGTKTIRRLDDQEQGLQELEMTL